MVSSRMRPTSTLGRCTTAPTLCIGHAGRVPTASVPSTTFRSSFSACGEEKRYADAGYPLRRAVLTLEQVVGAALQTQTV